MLDTLPKYLLDERDHVVLLSALGDVAGTAAKSGVHHAHTPFHLAFSCYVVRGEHVLLTRRASSKRTWPGVWTNACCGHPRSGETLREAATRHLGDELGVAPARMALALGDFTYRAEMDDGTVEHELCPVVVAEVSGEVCADPTEADDWAWVPWQQLVARARTAPATLSPWSVAQVRRLVATVPTIGHWLARHDPADALLDAVPGHRRIPATTAPAQLVVCAGVDERLRSFIDERRHDVPEAADAIGALHVAISSLTDAGGKRLRPTFVVWGHAASGGDTRNPPVDAAGAVELLHTFALLHDDVMDRSSIRRGRPTAQHAFSDAHATGHGDPTWFGISAAVLAGDLAFVWADRLFDTIDSRGYDRAAVRRARDVYTTLRTEVIAGQYLDVRGGSGAVPEESEAVRIALLKSARYTVTRPLQIGAALAGAGDELLDRLAGYGDAVGVAFQLRDDVLGTFGVPEHTGKSQSDDLRDGKRTLLVLRALELTTPAGRRLLERSLGASDLDEGTAQRCRDVIAASGALASVEAAIEVHLARALALAPTFHPCAAEALTTLAVHAAQRDR